MMTDLGYSDFLENYELSKTFNWSGGSYLCAIGERLDQKELGSGGFATQSDQTLVCSKAQFGSSLPQEKDQVTLDGMAYRIETVTHSPDNDFVVINLQDSSRGV